FGYNHLTQVVDIPDSVDKSIYDRDALGFKFKELFPDANLRNRYPRFDCGLSGCNFPGFSNNWESEGRQFAWTDNLTFLKGTHTFKTGVFFNMNRNGQQLYGQDSWKATRRLTLEYGARYAYLGPTYTTGDLLQNYFFVDSYDPA